MKDVASLIRYGISGVVGACVQVSTLWIWVDILGFQAEYLWGVAIGFCAALSVAFPLQKYWTFRDDSHHRTRRQLLWYGAFSLASLCLNTILLSLTKAILEATQANFFHAWYLVCEAVIIVVLAGVTFLCNRAVTFKTRPEFEQQEIL